MFQELLEFFTGITPVTGIHSEKAWPKPLVAFYLIFGTSIFSARLVYMVVWDLALLPFAFFTLDFPLGTMRFDGIFKNVNIFHGPSFSFLNFVCTCTFCLIHYYIFFFFCFLPLHQSSTQSSECPLFNPYFYQVHFYLFFFFVIFSIRKSNIFEVWFLLK